MPPPLLAPHTAAGTVPIAPSIAAVQCNNGLTTSCSLFNATPDSTPAVIGFGYWVLSALAMQGWVFYYSTVTMRYPTRPTGPTYVSALVRCRAQDTGSCATYNAFNDVRCRPNMPRVRVRTAAVAFACMCVRVRQRMPVCARTRAWMHVCVRSCAFACVPALCVRPPCVRALCAHSRPPQPPSFVPPSTTAPSPATHTAWTTGTDLADCANGRLDG